MRNRKDRICEECGVNLSQYQHLTTCSQHPSNAATNEMPRYQFQQQSQNESVFRTQPKWQYYFVSNKPLVSVLIMIVTLVLQLSPNITWLVVALSVLLFMYWYSFLIAFKRKSRIIGSIVMLALTMLALLTGALHFWIFALIVLVSYLVGFICRLYQSRFTSYEVTTDAVIYTYYWFFFWKRQPAFPHASIIDVDISQNPLEWLVNDVGDIVLTNIGGKRVVLDDVPQVTRTRDLILAHKAARPWSRR